MSDNRPKRPNYPKYPCGDCLVCQVPLAASDSPGRPQAPAPPQGPAAGPGIAPGLDAAGFGPWPSEEEIEAHGNGLWLIRQKGEMAPGQIRSMALGRFGKEEGRTVWWSGGRFSHREHMSSWTFCPVDENGDKLDAAPVLRGEDARRLAEQLGGGRRRASLTAARLAVRQLDVPAPGDAVVGCSHVTARLAALCLALRQPLPRLLPPAGDLLRGRHLAQLTVGLRSSQEAAARATTGDLERQQDALKALNLRPLTKADRCPRCDKYVVPCPKCPPGSLPKATESLGSGMEAPEAKVKYAVPVGPTGFENDRIGRIDHAARVLSTLPARSPDRRVLVVLRGLPGSGKSTIAQAIVDSDPARWVRVSKDDLRQMMVGPSGDLFQFVEDRDRERLVGEVVSNLIVEALVAGLDVVLDATNLTQRQVERARNIADQASWEGGSGDRSARMPVLVCERAVPTPVEECVARDAWRGKRSVGEAVIRRLAATVDLPLADKDQEVG